MNPITKLALMEWWKAKSWMLALALVVAGAIIGPLVVAGNIDPTIVPLARSQWIYAGLVLTCWFYIPIVVSGIGENQRLRNHRLFWRSQGVCNRSYFSSLLAAGLIPLLAVNVLALALLVALGNPAQPVLAKVQAIVLTVGAFGAVIPLCLGLSQLVSGAATFFTAVAVIGSGLFAPSALEFIRERQGSSETVRLLCEIGLALIPQLRIGDQAERLTFGWAAIDVWWFIAAMGYLALWWLILGGVGFVLFTSRKV